jgi:hypothetical protein
MNGYVLWESNGNRLVMGICRPFVSILYCLSQTKHWHLHESSFILHASTSQLAHSFATIAPCTQSLRYLQTCWRAYLWKALHESGITNIDFVGSHGTPAAGCTLNGQNVDFDKDNEGHSGAKVTDYASNNSLPPWLNATRPDMIIMHVGTNDAAANISTAKVFSAYDKLIGQMRVANPRTTLLASKLIPIDPAL